MIITIKPFIATDGRWWWWWEGWAREVEGCMGESEKGGVVAGTL